MHCPRCGNEARASRTTCPHCGEQLQDAMLATRERDGARRSQDRTARCGYCGCLSPEGAAFCTGCGQILDGTGRCPSCGGSIAAFDRHCAGCGLTLRHGTKSKVSSRPLAALILAIVPGMFSLWGIGHLFAGKLKKGLLFLFMGLLMMLVGPFPLAFIVLFLPDLAFLIVVGAIAWVVLWLYQSVDAYREAGGE
ncbi:MAG: hypothetical protein ISF22_10305 [Methanomassiliicoccus sp.]|nr:hypothetical protein [Methanomassiliicoccus sp.]